MQTVTEVIMSRFWYHLGKLRSRYSGFAKAFGLQLPGSDERTEEKMRDAMECALQRTREAATLLKKGGRMVAGAVHAAGTGILALSDGAVTRTGGSGLDEEVEKLFAGLGREIYDLAYFGVTDVFESVKVKDILAQIDRYYGDVDLINEKIKSQWSG